MIPYSKTGPQVMRSLAAFFKASGYPIIGVLSALAIGSLLARQDYGFQGAMLVLLGFALIGFLIIPWLARSESSRGFLPVLAIALVAALAGSMVRLYITFIIYGGTDALGYHRRGMVIANELRDGNFGEAFSQISIGTEFVDHYVGIVYALVGTSLPAAYLVFGLLSFLGSYFFYRAFRVAFPDGDRRLAAFFSFFWPSMLYWPNGISKDALMHLFIGLAAYGSALMLTGSYVRSLFPLAIGLLGGVSVRVHMAGVIVAALAVAFVLSGTRASRRSWMAYLAGIVTMVVVSFLVVPRAVQYAGIQQFDPESVQMLLADQQSLNFQGGSKFEPPSLTDPRSIPDIIAVGLFRPFPWEANNFQAQIQSLEGLLMLALVVWRAPQLLQAIRNIRRYPYLLFILFYVVMMFIMLATIANFGLLVRQRTMLLPLFFMLLAFQPGPRESRSASADLPSSFNRLSTNGASYSRT